MGRWLRVLTFASGVVTAVSITGAAMAATQVPGVTIKVVDKGRAYVLNKSMTDPMYFAPASVTGKSGQTLTFT
jgi:hypothetical protein